jgi:hypothetical protein
VHEVAKPLREREDVLHGTPRPRRSEASKEEDTAQQPKAAPFWLLRKKPPKKPQRPKSAMFALAKRVFRELKARVKDIEQLDDLKDFLRSFKVCDEVLAPLRISAFEATQAQVTFGVNTSGVPGTDFYLTILSDDTVLYSDGVDENNVPIRPEPLRYF